jgi:heme/copper-type cytochrome/quinol oxidase subunit 2
VGVIIFFLWVFVAISAIGILILPFSGDTAHPPRTSGQIVVESLVSVFYIVILAFAAILLQNSK